MTTRSPENQKEPKNLDEDFVLAFKLVYFDENDREVEPAQYKPLSTFSLEKDFSV